MMIAVSFQPSGRSTTKVSHLLESVKLEIFLSCKQNMAKIALTFDIVVAVIGQASSGKTTLINGLLRGHYGEVSMKKEGTTAGVYSCR